MLDGTRTNSVHELVYVTRTSLSGEVTIKFDSLTHCTVASCGSVAHMVEQWTTKVPVPPEPLKICLCSGLSVSHLYLSFL